MSQENIQTFYFDDDGRIPNNPELPLLVYTNVLPPSNDLTAACQMLFQRNNWGGMWVYGVYPYHHYHSNAHEVLGVVRGDASIQFGGEQGEVLHVKAGDVVIIPAGVGHCNQGHSSNFRVVGAYPPGQEDYDMCLGNPEERPQKLDNIRQVAMPPTDPVFGSSGGLLEKWRPKNG
ncbi:MAG TPA: cupin domain-containing protein [Aggregatilineales bacterium]|nr:cupin domain-containing protein [Aggregatilineales bacterium]